MVMVMTVMRLVDEVWKILLIDLLLALDQVVLLGKNVLVMVVAAPVNPVRIADVSVRV